MSSATLPDRVERVFLSTLFYDVAPAVRPTTVAYHHAQTQIAGRSNESNKASRAEQRDTSPTATTIPVGIQL